MRWPWTNDKSDDGLQAQLFLMMLRRGLRLPSASFHHFMQRLTIGIKKTHHLGKIKFTKMSNLSKTEAFELMLDRSEARRLKADAKANDRLGAREDKADTMIGELIRDGRTVFYINMLTRKGVPTGKTKEGTRHDLIAYLVRNNYA
jgi:hypothetical protein